MVQTSNYNCTCVLKQLKLKIFIKKLLLDGFYNSQHTLSNLAQRVCIHLRTYTVQLTQASRYNTTRYKDNPSSTPVYLDVGCLSIIRHVYSQDDLCHTAKHTCTKIQVVLTALSMSSASLVESSTYHSLKYESVKHIKIQATYRSLDERRSASLHTLQD